MDYWPEISVSKRKPLSFAKMAKRLRTFVLDNQRPDDSHRDEQDPEMYVDGGGVQSKELVCRVPDETLFQLQQICEALEAKTQMDGTKSKKKTSRVQSTAVVGDESAAPAASTPSQSTPKKSPSKKRSRTVEAPATDVINRHADANGGQAERISSKKKKKERRKSAST